MNVRLTLEEIHNAPKIRVTNASGMGIFKIDPKWMAAREREASEETISQAADKAIDKAIAAARQAHQLAMVQPANEEVAENWDESVRILRDGAHHTVHSIARRICKATGVSMKEIKGPGRTAKVAFVRHAIFYWSMRLCPRATYPQVALRLGRKDHTTVLHAARTYPDKREKEGKMRKRIAARGHKTTRAK